MAGLRPGSAVAAGPPAPAGVRAGAGGLRVHRGRHDLRRRSRSGRPAARRPRWRPWAGSATRGPGGSAGRARARSPGSSAASMRSVQRGPCAATSPPWQPAFRMRFRRSPGASASSAAPPGRLPGLVRRASAAGSRGRQDCPRRGPARRQPGAPAAGLRRGHRDGARPAHRSHNTNTPRPCLSPRAPGYSRG